MYVWNSSAHSKDLSSAYRAIICLIHVWIYSTPAVFVSSSCIKGTVSLSFPTCSITLLMYAQLFMVASSVPSPPLSPIPSYKNTHTSLLLQEFIPNFEEHGYTRFEFIWGTTVEDLKAIGIKQKGFLARLEKAIAKGVPPLFQSKLPVSDQSTQLLSGVFNTVLQCK